MKTRRRTPIESRFVIFTVCSALVLFLNLHHRSILPVLSINTKKLLTLCCSVFGS